MGHLSNDPGPSHTQLTLSGYDPVGLTYCYITDYPQNAVAQNNNYFLISYNSMGQEFDQGTPRMVPFFPHVMSTGAGSPKVASSLIALVPRSVGWSHCFSPMYSQGLSFPTWLLHVVSPYSVGFSGMAGGEGRAGKRKRELPGLVRPGLGSPRHIPSASFCWSKPITGLLRLKRKEISRSLNLLVTSELRHSPLEFTFCHPPLCLLSHDDHSLIQQRFSEHLTPCLILR